MVAYSQQQKSSHECYQTAQVQIRLVVSVFSFNMWYICSCSNSKTLWWLNLPFFQVINFYTDAIQLFIDWLYESVGKSGGQGLWETLVAYQLLIVGMEQTGIERTLGAVFYTQGGFDKPTDYRWYMQKMQVKMSNCVHSPANEAFQQKRNANVTYSV